MAPRLSKPVSLLLVAIVLALLWATGASDSYNSFWTRSIIGRLGPFPHLNLRDVVNEGLMTLFFLVVSLDIRRELFDGELSHPMSAALPLIAAAGGVVMPALVYLAFNGGTEAAGGWAIPTATDIAFVAGALALAGRSAPRPLKVFLIALAIADDIAAIAIIAIFYSSDLYTPALFAALIAIAILVALRRSSERSPILYAIVGIWLWLAFLASGVNATLAGVVIALVIPIPRGSRRSGSNLEDQLNKWSGLVIVPAFALANAGLDLSALSYGSILDSRVTLGVSLGLVIGKPVGIATSAALAIRLKLARLPDGVRWPQVIGAAALGGIGFTISLLVATLSFESSVLSEARLGILLGSVVSAVLGVTLLQRAK
ncbi:MAG: Na+:H+ antiporter, NhaA family [Actinomycetota bacterium]|nr:Na+:H+ antiporter, NhaA family [Actinomycetota bacterium]